LLTIMRSRFLFQAIPAGFRVAAAVSAAALLTGIVLVEFAGHGRAQQDPSLAAPGRIEGASAPLAIGVAAAGTVREVLVQPGSRVHAGDVLLRLDCQPLEAELRARQARLGVAAATYDRVKNGSRPDEIKVGEAVVAYSQAKADEAGKALDRAEALQEGVTVTTARILEAKRDARITQAQVAEARARLSLLRAGSREEDIRRAEAYRDAAADDVETARAQLAQCSVRAPVDGAVLDVAVNAGQYLSTAVPQPLLHLVAAGAQHVRAEVELRDAPRLCAGEGATVRSEAAPAGQPLRATVTTIGAAVSARTLPAGNDAHGSEVVPVLLTLDRGAPALPIGAPATVRFDPCRAKTVAN
jgi:HlyD family secretion protein